MPSLLLCFQAKNWRYWSNIGCYEFSFERTVFFELTDAATPLSCDGCEGSQLCKWCHNVFFSLTQITHLIYHGRLRLSYSDWSFLFSPSAAIVNTSLIPSPTTPDQIQHFIAGSIRNSDSNTPEEWVENYILTIWQSANFAKKRHVRPLIAT